MLLLAIICSVRIDLIEKLNDVEKTSLQVQSFVGVLQSGARAYQVLLHGST
jgi:hypothetical protein